MRTFKDADEYLGKRDERKLPGRATYLRRYSPERIGVVYHSTPVVMYHSTGETVLCSGGYLTVTTKARMNDYSGASIFQDRGVWYVGDKSVRYFDGITIGAKKVVDSNRESD